MSASTALFIKFCFSFTLKLLNFSLILQFHQPDSVRCDVINIFVQIKNDSLQTRKRHFLMVSVWLFVSQFYFRMVQVVTKKKKKQYFYLFELNTHMSIIFICSFRWNCSTIKTIRATCWPWYPQKLDIVFGLWIN